MREIIWDSWNHTEAYHFFGARTDPYYALTFRQDVTPAFDYAKANGLSFYHTLIWLCTRAFNAVEAFRYTVQDEKLYLLDHRDPSFTDMQPGDESFRIITLAWQENLSDFCAEAASRRASQRYFLDPSLESASLIYFSCVPWLEMTGLSSSHNASESSSSIPSLTWGRWHEENGRKILNMCMEANHRFIDGYHIGQFAKALEHQMELLQEGAPH